MHVIIRILEAGLLTWMALFAAILLGRVMRGDIQSSGGFLHSHRDEGAVAPERALSMAVFPVVIVGYVFSALHTDVSVTKSLPEFSNNMLMLLTGGNGIYLAGKIARIPSTAQAPNERKPFMTPDTISIIGFAIFTLILLLFAFVVLWKIYNDDISLNGLLAELPTDGTVATSKASLSRLQFLIFTFVVAGLFLLLSIEAGTFVTIPQNVLWLLGISGGTYVVSKGVSPKKKDAAPTHM